MDRFACRREVLKQLEALGPLEKVDDHPHDVGHCDRCKTVVEPALSTQWFVKMQPLAEPRSRRWRTGASDSSRRTGRRLIF